MLERLSLRVRIFLFFLLIAGGALVALAGAGLVAARSAPAEATADLVLAFGVAAFPIVGLCMWVWMKFDEHVARPISLLAAEIRSAVHAGAARRPDAATGRYLGLLGPAAGEAIEAIAAQRARTEAAIAAAVADAARQKSRLETVLRDLEEGVVICTLQHRIRLYNRHALKILHVSGELGLDRPLLSLVAAQPVRHTLGRLLKRFESGRHATHPEGLTALVVTQTLEGNRQLRGRMVLTLNAEGQAPAGYVISFSDITNELSAGIWRDRLLQDVTADMRERVTALGLAGEVLLQKVGSDPAIAPLAGIIGREPAALAERLDQLEAAAGDLLAGAWPMTQVLSPSLFTLVCERRSEQRDLQVEITGGSLWLHCDSVSVVDLLDRLMNRLAVFARTDRFRLSAGRGETRAFLDLAWTGEPVTLDVLAVWLDERLDASLGPITGRDVLSRHQTDVWCQKDEDGNPMLRLPLALANPREDNPPARLPERPLFYDFDLGASVERGRILETPLKQLTVVVFDTETTGLEPSRGDEIVQIAGVRIVNGRMLRGEVFDSFVDPGRRIPAASTKVHGITDAMVQGADRIDRVLPRFHGFVGEAVLCAHNAAFDMTFLNRHAPRLGLAFDGPVLDTVLLGGFLYGATESLTLDALAARFGIVIADEERHTALGDSIATALVLVRLFDLLEAAGVRTLGQALKACETQTAIRRAQKAY